MHLIFAETSLIVTTPYLQHNAHNHSEQVCRERCHTHEYARTFDLEPLAEEAADHYLSTLALEGLFTWKGFTEGIKNI